MNKLAKSKKKPLSPNQQAFKKEQNRLRAAQRRLEKQGYYFTESVIPQMPKRVTAKALQEIKGLRPIDLRRKALWVDSSTGELKGTGLELYARQRKQTSAKLSKAGKRTENVNRLRIMAARRAGKTIASYEQYIADTEARYYEEQKMIAESYDDQIVPHWRNLFASLESNYTTHEIVEAMTEVGGVPEPAYAPDPFYQWLQFSKFSVNIMRTIKSMGGNKIPPDVEKSIQQISAVFTDEYVLTEDDLDDIIYHDLRHGTTYRKPRGE